MHRKRLAPLVARPGDQPRPLPAGWLVAMLPAVLWVAVAASAADPEKEKKPPAASAAVREKKDDKEKPLPPPQDVALPTGDGIRIMASYFPGTKGKESVPVVLLHMWRRSRKDYNDLAFYLQSQGHAVLVPDLRGHGDSTVREAARAETIDAAKLSAQQFALMAKVDMKAVRDWLWDRNNAGELNLNKLCLVGAEMGAAVAVDFAAYDAAGYGEGNLPGSPYYGPLQLGRFVKALVLLSPEWAFKGLQMRQPLSNRAVHGEIAVMIFVGVENPKALADAKRIHGIFKPFHPEPEGEKKVEKKTLFLGLLNTSLQGTKLLDSKELHVKENIAQFIYLRLVKNAGAGEWAWKELKRPHQ